RCDGTWNIGFLVALLRGQLSGRCREPGFEELFYPRQYLRPALSLVDRLPQRRASGHAVREPRCKLLHLAFGSGHAFFQQHLEVGADHLVAVGFGGFGIELATRGVRRGASLRWTREDARRST